MLISGRGQTLKLIINNRDRLGTLQEMVAWGVAAGHEVIIVDQRSSYPPLLRWLGTFPCQLVRHENAGPWPDIRTGLAEFGKPGEVAAYTDSDLDLSQCPRDMLERFADLLDAHPEVRKVGCALRIDDLPDTPVANHAWKREAEFWPGGFAQTIYEAKIASTLAVYRVGERCRSTADLYGPALRVAGNCTARHRPWYYTEHDIPADERYYLRHLERRGPVFSRLLKKQIEKASRKGKA